MCEKIVRLSGYEEQDFDPMVNLFWLGRQTIVKFDPVSVEGLRSAMEGEAFVCRAVSTVNHMAFKSTFWHISAEPDGSLVDTPPRWRISSRFFGFRYPSVKVTFPHDWTTAQADLNKENLERYLRKLLVYPAEFVNGDREMCRQAILARKDTRLKESTGEFRKSKEAE